MTATTSPILGGMMKDNRFKTGQTVKIATDRFGSKLQGAFQIVRSLPVERDGVVNYRIKSNLDGHERIVSEGDITS